MPIKSDTFLRRAERDDLDVIVKWMDDPDFQRFLYGDPARSPKQIREQIVGMLGRSVGHTMPGGIYLMVDSHKDGPLGLVLLQNISWRNRNCSIDVYLGEKKFREGMIAGLATFRALEYCFDELNLHRVSAYIYAFNRPSWRTLEMTGAKRELELEQHILRDGELSTVYGYGLLKTEFEVFRDKFNRVGGLRLEDMIQDLAQREGAAS